MRLHGYLWPKQQASKERRDMGERLSAAESSLPLHRPEDRQAEQPRVYPGRRGGDGDPRGGGGEEPRRISSKDEAANRARQL